MRLAVFNHISSSCREDRPRIILNTTQKKAQKAMNIVCIQGKFLFDTKKFSCEDDHASRGFQSGEHSALTQRWI